MRVLVITNDFPPRVGGIQTYVAEIVRRLDAEVIVLASTSEGAAAFDARFPCEVVRVPTRVLLPTPGLTRRVLRLVRERRPDIVLFGAAMPLALIGPTIKRRTGVPYATFTHGLEIAAARLPGGRALLGRIGREASLVAAVAAWTRAALEPHFRCAMPIEILPSGVDTDCFRPGTSGDTVRARHHLGAGPVVVCVSRLVRRKGQDVVMRAMQGLAGEWPTLRFLVVGKGPDRGRLEALASRLGIADRVVFAGEVPDDELPAYFAAGDLFAMPCRSRKAGLEVEALGAVYLQAAAVGRPVVAGRSGGAAEAVDDGVTGLVVDGRSVQAVTAAMRRMLASPELARSFGERGAERVRRQFTWDRIAARCGALLAEAVTSR